MQEVKIKNLTYLLTVAVVLSVSSVGSAMSENEIIAGADARIEKPKHPKGVR